MPELLHENWENEESSDFGPVGERRDQERPALRPDARLVFSLRAAALDELQRLGQEFDAD
jgi:hypothetical protein